MTDLADHLHVLLKIRDEWNKAEETIKLAEQVCSKVVVPAIKELRYAGRRLVDVIIAIESDASKTEIDAFLGDAVFNCYRARHDAVDAATAQMALDLNHMRDHIGLEHVLSAYQDFPAFWRDLDAVKERVAESRGKRLDREAIYTTIETTDFPALLRRHRELMASEPLMMDLAKRARRRTVLNNAFGIAGVIGLVLSALSLFR